MAEMLSHRFLKPVLLLDQDGCVPAAYIRESFHVLRPQALRIVRGAFRRRGDATFRATYGPLSRWAYEHRRIPGALFFDLVELYRTNALYQGGLTSQDGRPVALSNVRAPMLVALATRDHIVPGASSHALASIVPGTETLACPSGHVSMLSGTGAHEVLWPGLTGFFARMEAGSRRPRTRRRPGASGAKKKGPGGASA
jgi:poly(3-hydroxyalkanoate) synthetase